MNWSEILAPIANKVNVNNLDISDELNNSGNIDLGFLDKIQDKMNLGLAFKNNLGNFAGMLGGLASGPVGWAGLALEAIGDNVKAAKSQFDLEGFKDMTDDAKSDFLGAVNSANTTNDLLGLRNFRTDFGDFIDKQGYKWDGNLLTGIGSWIGDKRTEGDKQAARDYAAGLEDTYSAGITTGQKRVSDNYYGMGMRNFLNNAAFGGPLETNGSDFTDDLIRIDAGGTHGQNPLGGVPAGIDPEGTPNLVEEGETIWDDYVFSDRLKAPKTLVKKFSLGGGKKGLTYSDAARKISQKTGAELRPNDPISRRTKEAQLSELEESQEMKRFDMKRKEFIKALDNMSPQEFEGLFMTNPLTQQEVEQPQMSPQGVNEGRMMQEAFPQPLVEAPIDEGPVGLMNGGYAFGGHKFVEGGEENKGTRLTAKQKKQLLFRDAYNKGLIRRTPGGYYSYSIPGYGAGAGVSFNTLMRKLGADDNEAMAILNGLEEELKNDLNTKTAPTTVNKSSKGTTAKSTKNSKERVAKAPVGVATSMATVTPYYNQSANKAADVQLSKTTPKKEVPIGNVDVLYDADIHPNLRGLRTFSNRGFTDNLYLPMDNYILPEGFGVEGESITNKGTALQAPTVSKPAGTKPTVKTTKPVLPDWINELDVLADSILSADPSFSVGEVPINLNRDNFTISKMSPASGASSFEGKMLPTWMRYAPVFGGAYSVLSDIFGQPDYREYEDLLSSSKRLGNPISIPVETIGNKIRRDPYDIRLGINRANQNLAAGIRNTMGISGGNRAYQQAMNNLLAYNSQNSLADIERDAYLAGRQDAFQTGEFNRGTDMYNASAVNQRNLAQAQLNSNRQMQGFQARMNALNALEGARRYDDAYASADFTGLMQSLGNIGNENEQRNWLTGLAKEGVLNFALSPQGVSFVPQAKNTVKCGGKIKTKKRRF